MPGEEGGPEVAADKNRSARSHPKIAPVPNTPKIHPGRKTAAEVATPRSPRALPHAERAGGSLPTPSHSQTACCPPTSLGSHCGGSWHPTASRWALRLPSCHLPAKAPPVLGQANLGLRGTHMVGPRLKAAQGHGTPRPSSTPPETLPGAVLLLRPSPEQQSTGSPPPASTCQPHGTAGGGHPLRTELRLLLPFRKWHISAAARLSAPLWNLLPAAKERPVQAQSWEPLGGFGGTVSVAGEEGPAPGP